MVFEDGLSQATVQSPLAGTEYAICSYYITVFQTFREPLFYDTFMSGRLFHGRIFQSQGRLFCYVESFGYLWKFGPLLQLYISAQLVKLFVWISFNIKLCMGVNFFGKI